MQQITEIYKLFMQYPVVSTDTRKISAESLFFALKGENFDGNLYATEALQKGASFAIIDNEAFLSEKTILVDNVLKCLQELALYHRRQLGARIIGITGTNGKTTSKELLNSVLSRKYRVLATEGNLNNHIGVPLTLLKLNKHHELAIVEMGANHVGEIAELCAIARPDFGIITNIGVAHLKGFGSVEGIKKAKTELYDFLRNNNGITFLNSDDSVLTEAAEGLRYITYGSTQADCTAVIVHQNDGTTGVLLETEGKDLAIQSKLFGAYNFYNLLLAICVGRYFEVENTEIQQALVDYQPGNNRSQIVKTLKNVVIMDAYNANPSSMRLALSSFNKMEATRKMLIMGDMLELGDNSKEEHQKIVELIKTMQFEKVYLVGSEFNAVSGNFSSFPNADDFALYLKKSLPENFTILLKGSRGISLEKIMEFIP